MALARDHKNTPGFMPGGCRDGLSLPVAIKGWVFSVAKKHSSKWLQGLASVHPVK
jgi:hypothetical protein